MVRPRAFAVLRLMSKSNFVGCSTRFGTLEDRVYEYSSALVGEGRDLRQRVHPEIRASSASSVVNTKFHA